MWRVALAISEVDEMLNETRNVFAQDETRINTSFTISGISTNDPLHKRTFSLQKTLEK